MSRPTSGRADALASSHLRLLLCAALRSAFWLPNHQIITRSRRGSCLEQLRRKLRRSGAGYIHHSNIGEYRGLLQRSEKWPALCQKPLRKLGILDPVQWRAFSMTASVFERCCERHGLQCIRQEQVNWGTRRPIDCFSTFVRRDSPLARPNTVVRNDRFMKEAALVRKWSRMSFADVARRRFAESRAMPENEMTPGAFSRAACLYAPTGRDRRSSA